MLKVLQPLRKVQIHLKVEVIMVISCNLRELHAISDVTDIGFSALKRKREDCLLSVFKTPTTKLVPASKESLPIVLYRINKIAGHLKKKTCSWFLFLIFEMPLVIPNGSLTSLCSFKLFVKRF